MDSSSSPSLQIHNPAKTEEEKIDEEPPIKTSPSLQILNLKEEKINEEPPIKTHVNNKYKEIMSTFPREKNWAKSNQDLYQYQDFWYLGVVLEGVISAQQHFNARSVDIILASFMKTGSTWLKALAFAIVTRASFDFSTNDNNNNNSPLLKKGPHDCVPFLEHDVIKDREIEIPLVSTHIPYSSLPKSIIDCGCKIVYIWRDPKDVFISMLFFLEKWFRCILPLEEAFELFCNGIVPYGPYWDHVLGYWKAKLEFPEKVLFLKYEEMKKDSCFYVKKLAEFMGYPFTLEEEEKGVLQKIVDFCSFENLSNLDVNKSGKYGTLENNVFFRKGKIGDWENYLTLEMGARLDEIMEQKLMDYGLTMLLSPSALSDLPCNLPSSHL